MMCQAPASGHSARRALAARHPPTGALLRVRLRRDFRFGGRGLAVGMPPEEAQVHPARADRDDMFQERLRPVAIGEDTLCAARLSLNAPIVSTPELTAGPARAAIVVVREEGEERVVVVVRSLAQGRVVQYQMRDEDLRGATRIATDAALSFAESMGFLFDDEAIAGQPDDLRERTYARLRELTASPGASAARGRQPETLPEVELDEILLDTEEQLDLDEVLEPAPDLSARSLSKFRGVNPAPPGAGTEDSQAGITLGRVRPIRRLPPDPPTIAPLLRLLASF